MNRLNVTRVNGRAVVIGVEGTHAFAGELSAHLQPRTLQFIQS